MKASGGVAKNRAASGGWATVKIGSGMSCEGGEADCVAQRKRRKDTDRNGEDKMSIEALRR